MDTDDERPEGWAVASISDIFASWGGATPSTSEPTYWDGSIPWISSKDVKHQRLRAGADFITPQALTETRLRLCPAGSVLVVVRSGILVHTLPIAVADAEVAINQDVKAFFQPEQSLNEWLALALGAMAPRILEENRKDGTTVHSIRFDQLRALPLRVPPLAEQRRIVAKAEELLSQVNAARERLARTAALLKRLRQSVLAAAYDGRLTADWRGDTTNENGDLPDGWRWTTLGDCFEIKIGSTPSRKRPDFWAGTIPWVSSGEVQFCRINKTREQITEAGLQGSSTQLNPPGTVLIGMIGEGKTRGQAAIVDMTACNNQNCAAIWVSETDVPPEFVYYWLMYRYEETRGEGAGNEQPALNKTRVRELPFRYPSIREQEEIVGRVDALFALADAIESRVAAATARAERLTQSVLAKAFRGELVPTEAELARREGRDYEPAGALLERIKSERDTEAPNVVRSRRKTRTTNRYHG